MDESTLKGKWNQVKKSSDKNWCELTEDDIYVSGDSVQKDSEEIEGIYHIKKEDEKQQAIEFIKPVYPTDKDKNLYPFYQESEEVLKYQLEFKKMLLEVSNTFSTLPSGQLEQSILIALQKMRDFFKIERIYIFQFSDDGKQMINTYELKPEEFKEQLDHRIRNIDQDEFPWFVEQIKNKKNVNIPDMDSLPAEAKSAKKEFLSHNICSMLSIPMMHDDIVFGFIGLAGVREKKIWTDNQIVLLSIITETVSNAYIRKMEQEKIYFQNFHDRLTGLHNRVYLEDEMERLDTDRQLPIGLIMIDSNGRKLFNDSFGHETGEEVLKITSEILKNSFRGKDIIARWERYEFVIILPQTTEVETKAICQRIDQKFKETYVKGIPLSLAVGIAIKNSTDQVLAKKLIEAEEVMYNYEIAESQWGKKSLVESLLKDLRKRNLEMESHYLGMRNVAQKIGVKKGLSQLEYNRLEMLMLMHDIGKMNIPEEVLNRKRPLTVEEWEVIKRSS